MHPVAMRLTCRSAYKAFALSESVSLQAAMDRQDVVVANMQAEIKMLCAEVKFLEGTCAVLGTYLAPNAP